MYDVSLAVPVLRLTKCLSRSLGRFVQILEMRLLKPSRLYRVKESVHLRLSVQLPHPRTEQPRINSKYLKQFLNL